MSEGLTGEPRASFPAGARCAHHPERAAERTCVRCGNYMCGECTSASGEGICLACASRNGGSATFPYDRDSYTFDGLLNLALSRWKQNWLQLGLAYLAAFFVLYVPAFAFGISAGLLGRFRTPDGPFRVDQLAPLALQLVGQLIAVVIQLACQLALFGYCLDLMENREVGIGRSLERARKLPSMLLMVAIFYASALVVIGVGGGLIYGLVRLLASSEAGLIAGGVVALLSLPLISYVVLSFVFGMVELAHNPRASAISALRTSWQLVEGKRWSVAGVLFVSGLISAIGVIACCVGLLASAPLGTLLMVGMFLALKQPGRPPEQLQVEHEFPV